MEDLIYKEEQTAASSLLVPSRCLVQAEQEVQQQLSLLLKSRRTSYLPIYVPCWSRQAKRER